MGRPLICYYLVNMVKIYLLDVAPLILEASGGEVYQSVREKLDHHRLMLLEKYEKNKSAYALSAGAGLILQYAYLDGKTDSDSLNNPGNSDKPKTSHDFDSNNPCDLNDPCDLKDFGVTILSLNEVLQRINLPLQVNYTIGEDGKPGLEGNSLQEKPFFFNLSHSCDRVCLAVSDRDIGVDIQIKKGKDCAHLAERFFTKNEADAVKKYGDDYFFRLWTRKESYGKCLGNGVRPAFGIDFTDLSVFDGFEWFEKNIEEYCLTVCCRKAEAG